MKRCDIIIPIYNAYECVIECIESVLKNTDFGYAHLIVIDDKSTDERMVPLLAEYEKKYPKQITFLRNDKNLGFVGTVNKGMKYSKNDVLLLNSDTEVPSGWLDRIIACAYDGEMIATVTPLSNNATLASVPVPFIKNRIPEGYNLETMNELVRDISMKMRPELPTAHGFCMFIKRSVLNEVGLFDEEVFGKGYGEENDFCFRCMRKGYRNILCDDVYVLHKESQSFLDKKEDHSDLLRGKHPNFTDELSAWCQSNAINIIGNNISIGIGAKQKRPNVLILIHDFSSNVGGTTLHCMDLINNLRDKANFHVLYPENGVYKVKTFFKNYELVTSVYRKDLYLSRAKSNVDLAPDELYSESYSRMIRDVLDKYKVSFVHIHHMLGHYFDIIDICNSRNIKYAVSLHDMYLCFPIANSFTDNVRDEDRLPMDVEVWRNECKRLLKNAITVISPSEVVKNKYKNIYGDLKYKVIPHGLDIKKTDGVMHKLSKGAKNIAFVGAIGPNKGSKILEKMVADLENAEGTKIHLFGVTTAKIGNNKNFINHGTYKRNELAGLLKENNIDLVCNFSLAFETYAYVVDEVVASGVPILSFDIGAGADRIKRYNLGWVTDITKDTTKIMEAIHSILDNPNEYNKVIESISGYKIRSVNDMAATYYKIYEDYLEDRKLDYQLLSKDLIYVDIVDRLAGSGNVDPNILIEHSRVVDSFRWKMVRWIRLPKWLSRTIRVFSR